jgi:cardiolipin synthase A/B
MLDLWTLLLAFFAVGGPSAATIHIVLTKRNPSTAVAWVGLVWLAPLLGILTYLIFGITRVQRRARALRGEDVEGESSAARHEPYSLEALAGELGPENAHLSAIARLADRVAGRPLLSGNRVEVLENGDEAYPAMLEAIEGAQRSIALCTYIFDHDPVGVRFCDALSRAVARGVEVRVLIDALGARYSRPSMVRELRQAGVRVARFHPAVLQWRMPYFNLRNHRKILVVDGTTGFTGGMNIRHGHLIGDDPDHPIRDLHIRIEGPVVSELRDVFTEDWLTAARERLEGDAWFPKLEPRGGVVARGISDGPDEDFEKLQMVLLGALATAERRVRVVTPYFIPDDRLVDALGVAALRGIEVEVYLPARGNLTLVQWASQGYWQTVLEKDVRLFATGAPFDHAKIMTVDGGWGLIGSANWDPRSLQLNFEFNVELYDPEIVGELDMRIDARRADSTPVTIEMMRDRPLLERLRDGLARLFSPML